MIVSDNYLAELPHEERVEEIKRLTVKVFSTPEGALVLSSILESLYWNREAETPDQVALRNYATYFVREHLGVRLGHKVNVAMLNTIAGATL